MSSPNAIDRRFKTLRREKRKALIGYITAGYPTKASLAQLVPALEKAGLDLLEIGIPFSDPIADGVTIQRSSQVALDNGVTLEWILKTIGRVRKTSRLPIIFMSYANPILAMGIDSFFRAAKKIGVSGLIIPDLIPEEAKLFQMASRRHGVHLIYLVSPTTPRKRIQAIARQTQGFLYAVALAGVTGARAHLSADLPGFLKIVRAASARPVAVGFGLSTPAQVVEAARMADGVIVGSALIKSLGASKKFYVRQATAFVASLRRALDRGVSSSSKGAFHAS